MPRPPAPARFLRARGVAACSHRHGPVGGRRWRRRRGRRDRRDQRRAVAAVRREHLVALVLAPAGVGLAAALAGLRRIAALQKPAAWPSTPCYGCRGDLLFGYAIAILPQAAAAAWWMRSRGRRPGRRLVLAAVRDPVAGRAAA